MSPQIKEEAMLFVVSAYGGIILILWYDVLRVFRRVFPASYVRVVIEDIIFWTAASIFMFHIFLNYNYGRPRFFAIGVTIGIMILYEWFLGRHIVSKMSLILRKIIKTLLKPLKKALKMFRISIRVLVKWIKRRVKIWPRREMSEEQIKEQRQVRQRD